MLIAEPQNRKLTQLFAQLQSRLHVSIVALEWLYHIFLDSKIEAVRAYCSVSRFTEDQP